MATGTRSPSPAPSPTTESLLRVRDLHTHYSVRGSFLDRMRGREAGSVAAVDGVDFELRRGEVLGLVGESGSGKTTLGRTILGLAPATSGSVEFDGHDITGLGDREMRPLRRRMQLVFQDPHASLNPAMTIGTSVGDPLRFHRIGDGKAERDRLVVEALERVGLAPAAQYLDKYPTDLSGGQKQRAVLARAIILGPDLLIADEPISMLDMSVRAKILELMMQIKAELDLTYVYITHDLATAKFFCDQIAIMYFGRIVEQGPAEQIFAEPRHPYTQALLRAVPDPDPRHGVPRDLPRGEIPDAMSVPGCCRFHPRCRLAFEACGWEARDLRSALEARWTQLSDEEYESDRAIVGNIDHLGERSREARVPAGRGFSGEDVGRLLETMRAEAPDDPLWRGIDSIEVVGGDLRVQFHQGVEPRRLPVDGVEVECHLHDPEVLKTVNHTPMEKR